MIEPMGMFQRPSSALSGGPRRLALPPPVYPAGTWNMLSLPCPAANDYDYPDGSSTSLSNCGTLAQYLSFIDGFMYPLWSHSVDQAQVGMVLSIHIEYQVSRSSFIKVTRRKQAGAAAGSFRPPLRRPQRTREGCFCTAPDWPSPQGSGSRPVRARTGARWWA